MTKKLFSIIFVLYVSFLFAQDTSNSFDNKQHPEFHTRLIDNFEKITGWKKYHSEDVIINTESVTGFSGKAIKLNYNFVKGAGYGGIQKEISLDLSGNFEFSFYIKADSPNNNLEFKLLDKSGENVWWNVKRNYTFPDDWQLITIKKRKIKFAWGPAADKSLNKIDKIEFTISSSSGGKGSVYIDELTFKKLPDSVFLFTKPIIKTSSGNNFLSNTKYLIDGNLKTVWQSDSNSKQNIIIDFGGAKELGGLIINWSEDNFAKKYNVYKSDYGIEWKNIYRVDSATGLADFIPLSDVENRFIKVELLEQNKTHYAIKEIKFKGPEFSEDPNKMYIDIAKEFPAGYFPRYFRKEATYWTVVGVNGDEKESLINEDGMVETDKLSFSIEPFLSLNNELITWNDVSTTQSLEEKYLPIPSVTWNTEKIQLNIKAFADGNANVDSKLKLIYTIKNNSLKKQKGKLYLAIRPFQVYPYYQDLGITGGVSKINSVQIHANKIRVNSDREIILNNVPDDFGAASFKEGDIIKFISKGYLPKAKSINSEIGFLSAATMYSFSLSSGDSLMVTLQIPYHRSKTVNRNEIEKPDQQLSVVKKYWDELLNRTAFSLPGTGNEIVNTLKSNLAYIFINRDKAGIQPGSRAYERSWIRDGALTSTALLRMGYNEEVKKFIEWYSDYLFSSGKVPCVVDRRGADPVPENDSNGEYIFLINQYFKFTRDTLLLNEYFPNVVKAVNYLESLIAQRKTDFFQVDSNRAFYGILPESISHEGYSAKPMHSYWDDFFALRGLQDAVDIASALGRKNEAARFDNIYSDFKKNLYSSINLAVKNHKINYIPGSVELGDFDATSTAISVYPGFQMQNLPQELMYNTFDKYYDYFIKRKNNEIDWKNYTPYEIRLITTFLLLNEKSRALDLLDYFMKDRRPQAWNEWAEVVWKDYRKPAFIGDMPHTWVGSEFVNAVRTMFVYENETDSSLVIASGMKKEWIESAEGVSAENLPTYYGNLSYSIKKEKDHYKVDIDNEVTVPSGGIHIKNLKNILPYKVTINGIETTRFNKEYIIIDTLPAEIKIYY